MAPAGNLKAILWDLDGTILDSREQHFSAWEQVFKEFVINISRSNGNENFGKTSAQYLNETLGNMLAKEEMKRLEDRRDEIYRSIVSKTAKFLPGIADWLRRFQEMGLIQVVASSTATENIVTILKALDAEQYFDRLFSGAQMPSKPDPAIFEFTSAQLGIQPQYCLVIEDSPFGVTAAKAAGMRCLAVTTTNDKKALDKADIILDSLDNLVFKDIADLFK